MPRKLAKRNSELAALAAAFQNESCSDATKRAYRSDWGIFVSFCNSRNIKPLPANTDDLILYLTSMADSGKAVTTIIRATTSINKAHELAGFESIRTPAVLALIKGIKRKLGKPFDRVKSISWAEIQKMSSACSSTLMGVRDRAVLLLGWTSALRRSELVSLTISDLEFCEQGLIVTIRRSKTDQEGKGAQLGIPYSAGLNCPVRSVGKWIDRLYPEEQKPEKPLFRPIGAPGRRSWCEGVRPGRLSPRMVSLIVKKYATLCGLSPEKYSSHSLRRGLATEAGGRRVPERIIARHTRHASLEVLRGYIDEGSIWSDNPLTAIYTPSSGAIAGLE